MYSFSEPQVTLLHWEAVSASCGHRLGKKIRPSMFPSEDVENFDHSLGKKEQYWNLFPCTKNKSKERK